MRIIKSYNNKLSISEYGSPPSRMNEFRKSMISNGKRIIYYEEEASRKKIDSRFLS